MTIKPAPVGMRAIGALAIRDANRPRLEHGAALAVDDVLCRVSVRHPADGPQPQQVRKVRAFTPRRLRWLGFGWATPTRTRMGSPPIWAATL